METRDDEKDNVESNFPSPWHRSSHSITSHHCLVTPESEVSVISSHHLKETFPKAKLSSRDSKGRPKTENSAKDISGDKTNNFVWIWRETRKSSCTESKHQDYENLSSTSKNRTSDLTDTRRQPRAYLCRNKNKDINTLLCKNEYVKIIPYVPLQKVKLS